VKIEGTGRRVRIYIGESDQWHGTSLYIAIVQEARRRGLAGATVARGIMGFGAHSRVHAPHVFSLSQDRPIVIEIVDSDEKVRAFLPVLDEMIEEGMITTSEVEIVSYRPGKP
jgi:PII-like signaling protein